MLMFVSCSRDNFVSEQPRRSLLFQGLPDTIQKLYIYFETIEDSSLASNGVYYICFGCHRDTLICLDQNIKKVHHKWKISYPEHFEGCFLFFDDKTLFLPSKDYPDLGEHMPYILYQKQLYFITSVNLISIADVKAASYGKYDISALLK